MIWQSFMFKQIEKLIAIYTFWNGDFSRYLYNDRIIILFVSRVCKKTPCRHNTGRLFLFICTSHMRACLLQDRFLAGEDIVTEKFRLDHVKAKAIDHHSEAFAALPLLAEQKDRFLDDREDLFLRGEDL